MKKRYFLPLFILNLFFLSPFVYASLSTEMSPLVEEINTLIQAKYIVGDVDNSHLTNGAIDGMLRSLDPYSAYFNEEELQHFKNNTDGRFQGIGIVFSIDANSSCPVITTIFQGSPAAKAGIMVGDTITHINDIAVNGKTVDIISRMIKGEKGTAIKLTIFRSLTNETFSITLRRGDVKIPNVVSKIYKNSVAIMEVKLFNQQTYNDFVDQLNDIRKQYHIKGLILDLRNNPGGLLESAVDIANLFLQNGQLITSVKGRNNVKVFDYVARNKQDIMGDTKIAILINKGSASASEILAGCLQDYGIAKLIGEQTFGKALVQEVFTLNNSKGAVKITTGQYHTPKDKQINGVGITPDIPVKEKITTEYDAILQAGINYVLR